MTMVYISAETSRDADVYHVVERCPSFQNAVEQRAVEKATAQIAGLRVCESCADGNVAFGDAPTHTLAAKLQQADAEEVP